MVRAIRIHATGGPEQMRLEEVAPREVGRGEVLLEQTAVGVNFLDVYQRSGLYPLAALPSGLGNEAVGVVLAIGPGVPVDALRVGDRVGYVGGEPGAYADERVVPAFRLLALPDGLDDVHAAGMLLKGLTAEYLVRRTFRIGPGHRVLVHAAAGGVGLLLCQWLQHLGAVVFGTVGTAEKAALAAEHGCHHPIVYTQQDFAQVVQEITKGKGVDVVYDSVGKATIAGSLACLRPRGMLVSFGNASGAPEPIDPLELSRRGSLFLTRPSLQHYIATRPELVRAGKALFGAWQQGALRPRIDRVMTLGEAGDAHRLLESRATAGAVVLRP